MSTHNKGDGALTLALQFGPAVAGVLALVLSAIFKLSNVAPVYAVGLTVVLYVFSLTTLNRKAAQEALQYAKETQQAVKRHLHATRVGTPEQALDYIVTRLPAIKKVKNTSFNLAKNLDIVEAQFYDKPAFRRFDEAKVAHSVAGLTWIDIGDSHALGRFRRTDAECRKKASGKSYGYKPRLLSDLSPQMNFTIIEYAEDYAGRPDDGGRLAEVLFNWDFRNTAGDPDVYMSTDRDLISMFNVHFETMLGMSSIDHDMTQNALDP